MSYIMVDIEADGPCPGLYSMISLGAIVVEPHLNQTFFGELAPISENFSQDALNVTGISREETLKYPSPGTTIKAFHEWLRSVQKGKLFFIADTGGFDWQFVNYYFWLFLGGNPFGHNALALGSIYKGFERNMFKNFKHLRKTKHTHNPVDDAKGNAEAFLSIQELGLKT